MNVTFELVNNFVEEPEITVYKVAKKNNNGQVTEETTGTYHIGLFEVTKDADEKEIETFVAYKPVNAGENVKFTKDDKIEVGKTYRVYELSTAVTEENKEQVNELKLANETVFGAEEYKVMYDNNQTMTLTPGDVKKSTIVTNEHKVTQYIVQKRWMVYGGTWDKNYGTKTGDITTIYFRLYRTVNGDTYPVNWDGEKFADGANTVLSLRYEDTFNALTSADASSSSGNVAVEKGEELHWTKQFANLVGEHGEYHAVECSQDGTKEYGVASTGASKGTPYEFYQVCPELGPDAEKGEHFVETSALKNDVIKVNAKKVWKDNGVAFTDEQLAADDFTFKDYVVVLQLKRGDTVIDKKIVGKAQNWTYTWEKLAKNDPATAELITYTVEEIGVYASRADAEANGGAGQKNLISQFTQSPQDTNTTESAGDTYTITITNDRLKTGIKIVKVDSKDDTKKLSGAEFKLEKETGVDDQGQKTYELIQENVVTDADGAATISNLLDGNYRLIETKAPAGYTMTSDVVEFKVAAGVVSYTDVEGDLITYTPVSGDNTVATFQIGNVAGVELPSTGGTGTLVYTMTGLALMLLAGVVLISRKQKYNR